MLNHVENFWIKGVLEKSLHGAALLELGIKEDPTAITYPWTIKKESTNETLPAGKSMLEIFEEIGAGRSLLILGAPGAGKTTMLLELTRQLIKRAREDTTEPIPVVFNLASWTEKQTLAVWLAEQLNSVYYVPKKTGEKWVGENKMLLLLDGLDEVKGESREKCVEAINQFRSEHGLTSLVVCSRIEEYSAIQTKLSFEGAIALQPLTSKQVNAYFDRFGKSLAAAKGLLRKDKVLLELAETPLMLSIMALAYKDKKPDDLPLSNNITDQRKHLFDAYINRMFERPARTKNEIFSKTQTLHYLRWLARKMTQNKLITYQIEAMQPDWLENGKQQRFYKWIIVLSFGLIGGQIGGVRDRIVMVDKLIWSWQKTRRDLSKGELSVWLINGLSYGLIVVLSFGLIAGLIVVLSFGLIAGLIGGLSGMQIEETNYPGQRITKTFYSSIKKGLSYGLFGGLSVWLIVGPIGGLSFGLIGGLIGGLSFGLNFGLGDALGALIKHYVLRNILIKNGSLPRRLVPFFEYAVDLIFLRRVGGSYIFVHRLLMEHFAEMEVESG